MRRTATSEVGVIAFASCFKGSRASRSSASSRSVIGENPLSRLLLVGGATPRFGGRWESVLSWFCSGDEVDSSLVLTARVDTKNESILTSFSLKNGRLLTSSREGKSIAVLRVLCLEVLGSHLSSSVGKCPQLVLCVVDLRGEGEEKQTHIIKDEVTGEGLTLSS